MAGINEEARIPVYLNDEQAKSALKNLQGEADKWRKKMYEAMAGGDMKGMKEAEREMKKAQKAAAQLRKEAFDVNKVLDNLSTASYKDLQKTLRKLTSEQQQLTRGTKEYTAYSDKIKLVRSEMGGINKELREQRGLFSKTADFVNRYWSVLAGGFGTVMIAWQKLSQAAEAADNFEERLDNLSALTGLEGQQLEKLGETAKQTSVKITEGGVRIKQSADDIVDAYTKVGSQRPELLKNGEALASVTEDAIILSEAAKSELDPAVKGLTTTMNQFNIGAEGSRRIINSMAAGSKEGAADIPYLTQAIEKSGTTMNLMNVSLEENIGLIESIAPNYAKAEMAGNSLDKVFLKLKEKQIGYKDGVFSVNAALEELEERYKSGESAASIFGVEHAKMGELLVQNRDEFNRYTKAVTGTNVAIEQASKNTNNAKAIQQQARNEFHLAAIELGENLSPAMVFLYKTAGKIASAFSDMITKSPVDMLRDEQTEVNGLVVELQSANTKEERRKEILGQLKELAPGLLKTITDEKTNIEDLTEAVAAYNDEMALKMLIASGEEDIAKQKSKVEAFRKLSLQAETELAQQMRSSIDWFEKKAPEVKDTANAILFDTQKTLLQKAEELNSLALDNTALGNTSLFTALDSYRIFKQNYAQELNSLNILVTKTGEAKEEWKSIFNSGNAMSSSAGVETYKVGTRFFLNGIVWEWDGKELRIFQKPESPSGGNGDNTREMTTGDNETTLAALELANKQRILALKEQYANEETLQKEYQARLLANELAYLQAKEKLTIDEKDRLDLQSQIIDKQKEYNEAVKAAIPEIIKTDTETQNLNTRLLEESKIMSKVSATLKKAQVETEEMQKKQDELSKMYQGTISVISDSVYEMASGTEDAFKTLAKNILIFALEQLKVQTELAIAGVTIQGLASLNPALMLEAAAKIVLIESVFAGVEGLVNKAFSSGNSSNSYAEGGYTGPGGKYEIAGSVHRDEYVIPTEGTGNPTLTPFIDIIEIARRNGNLARLDLRPVVQMISSGKSLAVGGYASGSSAAASGTKTNQSYTPVIIDVDKFDRAVTRMEKMKLNFSYSKFKELEDRYNKTVENSKM